MKIIRLSIEDAYIFTPSQHTDDRGSFQEWFREDDFLQTTGHRLHVAQANSSVSAAGTIRGVHFADLPPGQAKYVTCLHGSVFDVIVDIRAGSPTFGAWDAVVLDSSSPQAVYISEGLGHAFMALENATVVSYLCSAPYAPAREHAINPLDTGLDIAWPSADPSGTALKPRISAKDSTAPSLAEARQRGLLPGFEDAHEWIESLRDAEISLGTPGRHAP